MSDKKKMFPIPDLDSLEVAFPTDVLKWIPKYEEIPDHDRKFDEIGAKWFFTGLHPETEFVPKPGVDAAKALRAVRAVTGSFEPKHEHKEYAVGYLLSEWFSEITGWETKTKADKALLDKVLGKQSGN